MSAAPEAQVGHTVAVDKPVALGEHTVVEGTRAVPGEHTAVADMPLAARVVYTVVGDKQAVGFVDNHLEQAADASCYHQNHLRH